jgi:Holliday junction DNA helicase RuvA
MIAQLTGTVIQLGPTSAVIEVGGFGVLALCSPNTTAGLRLGETATLSTSLVVREDSLTLYAFATVDERELFELLQTATGVGPKLAQAALAVLPPDELRSAIATENLVQLCKVPGVGRKGAQRLVLELKDKINAVRLVGDLAATTRAGTAATSAAGWRDQVSQGLQGLGWSIRDAEAACDEVEPLAGEPGVGVPQLMRAALQSLARP